MNRFHKKLSSWIVLGYIVLIGALLAGFQNCAKIEYKDPKLSGKISSLTIDPTTTVDSDHDGLPDLIEGQFGTDPQLADSDNDGLNDGIEAMMLATDPLLADSDGGGASDSAEVNLGLNPLDPSDDSGALAGPSPTDSDGDGLCDSDEIALGTQTQNVDSDNDGLSDGAEVHTFHTLPLLTDSDSGGLSDGEEVSQGKNPHFSADDPSGLCTIAFGTLRGQSVACNASSIPCPSGAINCPNGCPSSKSAN